MEPRRGAALRLVPQGSPRRHQLEVLRCARRRRRQRSSSTFSFQGRGRARLGADLPTIAGDRTQLQQVFVNLALNATQAMAATAERRLSIDAAVEKTSFRVSVEAAAPSFGEAQRERMFETFFSTNLAGTGKGLPISRSIVEARETIAPEHAARTGALFVSRFRCRVWLNLKSWEGFAEPH